MTPHDRSNGGGRHGGRPTPPEPPSRGEAVVDPALSPSGSPSGVELAEAVKALSRAIDLISMGAGQQEGRCRIDPVELLLQVMVCRTAPGSTGIEWRVLGPSDEERPHASAVQTLKIRLALLSPESGHTLAETAENIADEAGGVSTDSTQSPVFDYEWLDDGGGLSRVLEGAVPPGDIEAVRLRIYEPPSGDSPGQVLTGPPGSLAGSRPVTQLVMERDVFTVPDHSKILEAVLDTSAETMAQYIANQEDPAILHELSFWRTNDPGGFAGRAQWVAGFQDRLHEYLIGHPVEEIASRAGLPDASGLGLVAAAIPIPAVDSYLKAAGFCIEIIGVVTGAAVGMPILACASLKALARETLHNLIADGIKKFIAQQPKAAAPNAQGPAVGGATQPSARVRGDGARPLWTTVAAGPGRVTPRSDAEDPSPARPRAGPPGPTPGAPSRIRP
jgi:hypothetical protein